MSKARREKGCVGGGRTGQGYGQVPANLVWASHTSSFYTLPHVHTHTHTHTHTYTHTHTHVHVHAHTHTHTHTHTYTCMNTHTHHPISPQIHTFKRWTAVPTKEASCISLCAAPEAIPLFLCAKEDQAVPTKYRIVDSLVRS